MTIRHHLDDATVVSYAAGTLGEALAVVAAAHVAMCGECRARVRAAETAGGALLEAEAPAELGADALAHMMARIERAGEGPPSRQPIPIRVSDPRVPAPLAARLGTGLDDIRWRWLAPGVASHQLAVSPTGGHLQLLRITNGVAMPEHGHGGTELTLVLAGSYRDETGQYRAGDVADLDSDVEHAPAVDSDEDCICLVATEAPTRFKTLLGRILQPYLRI